MAIGLTSWGKWLGRYGGAVAAAVAGLLIRWALEAWVGPGLPHYLTFYPSVMAVALLGGLGPGMVTTAAAALLAEYWVIPPHGFGIEKPADLVGIVVFMGMGLFMCLVAEYARRVRLKAAAYDREQALRETLRHNEFLANIIERSSQPFAVGYLDGRLGLVNPAFEQLTGYTAEELRSLDWGTTLTPPEWRDKERGKLEELARTGQPVRYEKEYVRKDGRRVPIELLVHLARDAKGEPEYYYTFLRDITERRQIEATLVKLNQELEQRVMEQTAQIRQANEELERRVSERTVELQAAKEAVHASRGSTLSLLEDALEARAGAEQANEKLKAAVESLEASQKAALNLMEDSLRARAEAEAASAELRGSQERLLKLNRVLKALKDSSLAMIRATSEAEYVAEVCKIVVEDCGQAMVWIGFAEDDEEKTVRPVAYAGFEQGYLEAMRVSWADTDRGHGPTGTAIRTGQVGICGDMQTNPAFGPWREEALKRGYASSLAVPLLAAGTNASSRRPAEPEGADASARRPYPRTFGALTIYAREADAFAEDEVTLLTQLADDVAYCIGALRLQVQRRQAEARTELLADTASRLLASDSPQRIVEDLCRRVMAFLGCHVFFNFLVDERAKRLHLNACGGVPAEEARRFEWLDFGTAVCGCAARDAERVVVEDIQQTDDPRTELIKSLGVQAYAAFPLIAQGRVLGTLSFGLRDRPRFTQEELSLMKAVADQVAIAIERQRVQAALRQAAENLKRSNLDLEQFAYVASHDLQEPLRAVGGYVKLLERNLPRPLDARIQGFIHGAFEGAVRMERLINDLLDYSRVDSRGRALVPTELDNVLRVALDNLQPRIASANAVVTCEALPKVAVDSTQIMQVFQNLIGNALKFRGEPPPAVHVGASQQDGAWVISVRDNGIGIAPEYFGKLFHLFQRLHTRKEYPGTGIGLAVCKRIVERHGGTIWVESQLGQGATFFFSIPKGK
jgi:PAS domain S-box-containing protein